MTDYHQEHIQVDESFENIRLDKALAIKMPDQSRARLQALIKEGHVTLNGKPVKTASSKLSTNDEITVMLPEAIDADPEPENIPLNIIYEDDDIIVISKAAGIVVHPAVGNLSGTLVNALLYHCADTLSGIGGVKRPGIVHRLDKETSGLMIVAKNDQAHHSLSDQLKDRSLSRVYTAFTWRAPTIIKGAVDEPIGRHASNRLKMAIMKSSGREAKTHYLVEKKFGEAAAQIQCKLESGRTHQIRVHMQHLKHQIIGDPLYGLVEQEARAILKRNDYDEDSIAAILDFPRQALHASEICFSHPKTEENMTFSSELPEDMRALKNHLKSIC
ncbi:MAG: RluA family pseudouridine synthase [Pseudomonadota bacterium]